MLSPLLLAFAVVAHRQEPAPAPTASAPTAAGLISKMLQRYASTKSLAATIRTTQSAGGKTVVTETALAFERPGKIRVDQQQVGEKIRRKGLLVSDGENVLYSKPEYLADHVFTADDKPYLVEPVRNPRNPEDSGRKTEELYDLAASAMPDRSPVLDMLAGGVEDRKYFAGQLAAFDLKGKETVNGVSAHLIEGSWREVSTLRSSGQFKIYLTEEGEIVRYVLTQNFAVPASGAQRGRVEVGSEPIPVTTVWDAKIDLNPAFKPGTFDIRE